ncbi:response regulator [Thalassolituus sp. LLYu03]|uniref:response regulator n=1 Tax=Thalassolituus sp. LLYu03 TaxID=3421656 RepID=UPI003D2CBDB2
MNAGQVLIVDDAADNRMLLSALLETRYQTQEADSGEACLTLLQQKQPDLILLDVSMPGISGYDTCVKIRQSPLTATIPVIFVSAKDSPEERLEGFEAGADDYITKPIDGATLLAKVEHHIQRTLDKKAAQKQSQEAMNVAMEAMTSSSELGQIIQFVKEVQGIKTAPKLAAAVMTVASQFGLNACVLVSGEQPAFIGCGNESVEAKVLMKFRESGQRITHLGIRTIIQSGPVLMLIKNMPAGDEARYGRLKDHLAVLADIASDRAKSILAETLMHEQRIKFLKEIIAMAELNIEKTSDEIREYSESVTRTVNGMVQALEAMLFSLGLEEDQEKELMQLANETTDQLDKTTAKTHKLDTNLTRILEALYDLLDKQ